MLHTKKLNLNFWREAVQAVAHLLNRTASRTRSYKSSYKLWIRRVLIMSNLCIFGCTTYVHIRIRSAPTYLQDYVGLSTFVNLASSQYIPDDSNTYEEALTSLKAVEWKKAIEAKHKSLLKNETLHLVFLPPDQKPMHCKWIYTIKTHSNGSIAKFKSRLVMKGYTQQFGVDYDQMFSPLIKYESIQTVLAIAAQQCMPITQFDIQTSFLYGSLDTKIYMQHLEGFEIMSQNNPQKVCLLLKSLYGLKQSEQIGNQKFHKLPMKFNLEPREVDLNIYIFEVRAVAHRDSLCGRQLSHLLFNGLVRGPRAPYGITVWYYSLRC